MFLPGWYFGLQLYFCASDMSVAVSCQPRIADFNNVIRVKTSEHAGEFKEP
jgi:hypothetical protein